MARQIPILTLVFLTLFSWATDSHAKPKSVPQKLPARLPASFVEGTKRAQQLCKAYAAPTKGSKVLFKIKKGRKIWLTGYDRNWMIAYTKKGQKVFVQSSCFR